MLDATSSPGFGSFGLAPDMSGLKPRIPTSSALSNAGLVCGEQVGPGTIPRLVCGKPLHRDDQGNLSVVPVYSQPLQDEAVAASHPTADELKAKADSVQLRRDALQVLARFLLDKTRAGPQLVPPLLDPAASWLPMNENGMYNYGLNYLMDGMDGRYHYLTPDALGDYHPPVPPDGVGFPYRTADGRGFYYPALTPRGLQFEYAPLTPDRYPALNPEGLDFYPPFSLGSGRGSGHRGARRSGSRHHGPRGGAAWQKDGRGTGPSSAHKGDLIWDPRDGAAHKPGPPARSGRLSGAKQAFQRFL